MVKLHDMQNTYKKNLIIITTALLCITFCISNQRNTTSELSANILSVSLVRLTNEKRLELDLPILRVNSDLRAAAQLKANDMVKNGYFAHYSPDGKSPWYWMDEVGYAYLAAGENLAVAFSESDDVVQAWMNSPKHRENILNPKYSEIGVAMAHGQYMGESSVYVVELMAKPHSVK
jgi:uncharacterized protein YkwD